MDNSIEKCNFAVGEMIEGMIKIKNLFVLVSVLVLTVACSNSDNDSDSDVARLLGKIVSYNEFDGAMLDITEADMTKAGFSLGDVIRTAIIPTTENYCAWPIPPIQASASLLTTPDSPRNSEDWRGTTSPSVWWKSMGVSTYKMP